MAEVTTTKQLNLYQLSLEIGQPCAWRLVGPDTEGSYRLRTDTVDQATLAAAVAAHVADPQIVAPKPSAQLAEEAAAANEATVNTFLTNAVAIGGTLDLIISTPAAAFTQQGLRDLQAQVKDIARIDRREIRKLLRLLESAT